MSTLNWIGKDAVVRAVARDILEQVARSKTSRTAPFLRAALSGR